MRALIWLLLLAAMAGSSTGQSSLVPCVEIGPVYASGHATDTVQAYCISSKPASSSTSPTHLNGNQRIALHSLHGVRLNHGFKAGGFSASGGFYATATANKVDAVVMAPNDYDGTVCMFEKFEIGLQLPDSVIALIDTFLANGAGGLNPFEPLEVDVGATFFKQNTNPQLANAFYMYDYQLLENANTGKVEQVVRQQNNNFPWRVRHAFTESGTWTVNVTASINGGPAIALTNFTVQATDCGNPGYLTVGQEDNYNDHYLRYSHSGEGFFALGININADKTFVARREQCTDSTYEYYNQMFAELNANGANYVRVWAHSPMLGPEWEQLGNYATDLRVTPVPGQLEGLLDRQGMAFVWDQLLDLAEQHSIKLQVCIETSHNWNSHDWPSNPYVTTYGLDSIDQFLTNGIIANQYKKKLRYLIARYGYSSAIAAWEFWNELDHLWANGRSNEDSPLGAQTRARVRFWHEVMGGYIKNDLHHTQHPLTTSYASGVGFKHEHQMPWTLPEIDIVQYHKYSAAETHHTERFNLVQKYMDFNFAPWSVPGSPTSQKPIMLGEIGGFGPLDKCYDRPFKTRLWSSAFHGTMGSGLSWEVAAHQTRGDFQHFLPLATFLDGVDWIGREWKPDEWKNSSKSNSPFEVYSLSAAGNSRAIGWAANRTYDWSNLKDSIPCIASIINSGSYTEGEASEDGFAMRPISNKRIRIKDLAGLTQYTIEWWNPDTGQLHSTSTKVSAIGGSLRPILPATNASQASWAFKAYKTDIGQFKFEQQALTADATMQSAIESTTAQSPITVVPNPNSGQFSIFNLPSNAKVFATDLQGRPVKLTKLLINGGMSYCIHSKGVYFVSIFSNQSIRTEKVIIL